MLSCYATSKPPGTCETGLALTGLSGTRTIAVSGASLRAEEMERRARPTLHASGSSDCVMRKTTEARSTYSYESRTFNRHDVQFLLDQPGLADRWEGTRNYQWGSCDCATGKGALRHGDCAELQSVKDQATAKQQAGNRHERDSG